MTRTSGLVCAALLLLGAPALAERAPQPAGGREFVDYTIQAGDTCASIAERVYGDRRHASIVHDYNPHATRDPSGCNASLQPGTRLRLPREAPTPSAPDAEVTGLHRVVRSRPPGRDTWAEAYVGQALFRGWRVNTLEQAAAELAFRDASLLRLRENTLVIIFGPTQAQARRSGTKAVLEEGALRSRLSELSGGVRVETPSAQVDLAAGSSLVSLDRERTSRVANFEGREVVVATAQGRAPVKVARGMGTKVSRTSPPTPPRPLPPSPAWLEGDPSSFVALVGRSVVGGSWAPVAGAAFYRVEIALERDGRNPMGAVGVPASITSFELRGLAPGTYHVAVSAIDADQFESPPSAWRELRVVEARLVEPAGTAPQPRPASPDEAAAPLRVAAGTSFVAPQGYRCAAGAGQPAEQVALTVAGATTVRCIGSDGGAAGAIDVEVIGAPAQVAEVEAAPTVAPAAPGASAPATDTLPWLAAYEATWALNGPNAIGVRDNRRAGLDLWLAGGGALSTGEEQADVGGLAFGTRFGFASDRVRLDLGFSPGVGDSEAGAHLGLVIGVLVGPRYWLSLGADTWLPIQALEDSVTTAQVLPSADFAVWLGPSWLLRTRQGALLDAGRESGAYWASAYAADVALHRAVFLSVEGVLLLGAAGGDLRAAPALGVGLTVHFWDRVDLKLGGRAALTRDAAELMGEFSMMASIAFSPVPVDRR